MIYRGLNVKNTFREVINSFKNRLSWLLKACAQYRIFLKPSRHIRSAVLWGLLRPRTVSASFSTR